MTRSAHYLAEWSRKARRAIAARNRWIVRMRDEGAPLREIGEAAGLSHETVRDILARQSKPLAERERS